MVIAAEARLAAVADGRKIWSGMWAYRSPPHPFCTLAANDGRLLHDEIVAGLGLMATTIANDVFVVDEARSEPEIRSVLEIPYGVVRAIRPSVLAPPAQE